MLEERRFCALALGDGVITFLTLWTLDALADRPHDLIEAGVFAAGVKTGVFETGLGMLERRFCAPALGDGVITFLTLWILDVLADTPIDLIEAGVFAAGVKTGVFEMETEVRALDFGVGTMLLRTLGVRDGLFTLSPSAGDFVFTVEL